MIETLHVPSGEITDISDRIFQLLQPILRRAFLYLKYHLCQAQYKEDLNFYYSTATGPYDGSFDISFDDI